jgi:tetratricopeptide (TPR) repeat protein
MKKAVIGLLMILFACNSSDRDKAPAESMTEQPGNEKKLREAILKYPDSLLIKETLIQYLRENGHYSKAINEVNKALERDSMNARLWEIKATLQFENEDTINAIRSFERSVSIFPDPQNMISLGTLYAEKKDPRSLKLADILLSTNNKKTDKEAIYIKGLYHSFNKEKIKAISFFDSCLSLNYTFMNAYREKAIALYDLGKYSEALAVLDKAITLQNNFDEGYYYSGQCLEKLNRIPEAITSYQNALAFDPEYAEAKEALTRLGGK